MSSTLTTMKQSVNKVDGEGGMGGREVDVWDIPLPEEQPRRKPQRQYSREELIELMTHPLSSVKHPALENSQNKTLVSGKSGVRWLEDHWDHRKHTDSLTDEDRSDGSVDPQKKRMNDPKTERLRKEQDVVLSPQRRSFNSGCYVNQPLQPQHSNAAGRRPDSPLSSEREVTHRDIPARRIGSGRIIRDPMWDYRGVDKEPEVQNINNHEYNYRQRDDRFERRSYERSHDKERPQQRNSRYNNNNNERKNNKYEKHEPEEPEWFSGGPTSQHDTIELHGFDGPQEDKSPPNKRQNKNAKNSTKAAKKSTEPVVIKAESSAGKKPPSRKSSPEIQEHPRLPVSSSPIKDKLLEKSEITSSQEQQPNEEKESKTKSGKGSDCLFDFEDILNFDSLPPILSMSNGCVDETSSGSRFSQFFRRESPSPKQGVQRQDSRGSVNDDMFNSIINDITNTNISIPLDGDTYFAPISPAASSVKEESGRVGSASLLEMLQRGGAKPNFQGRKITKKPSLKDLEACGKIHSVEELEARLRQEQGIQPNESSKRSGNKEEELAAFRKLMMAKQNAQDQKSTHGSGGGFPGQQNQQQQQGQMPIPHDLVLKLLHVQQQQHHQRQQHQQQHQQQQQQHQQQQQQQEAFAKLLAPPNRYPPNNQFSVPPPMPPLSPEIQMHINNAQPSKELLQRPEAQNILRRLKRGETTIHQLIEQLKRSVNMQPIHREMISSIIKLHGIQPGVHQRDPSPGSLAPPPLSSDHMIHQMMHNQHPVPQPPQQLRIPSPHTNAAFGPPPVVSPNLQQNSSNSLTIQPPHPVMQRVPSPRELVAHTQNILQNALLKKKLEEQKENFRKRQELHGGPFRSHSPNPGGNTGSLSPINHQSHTTSPTPLAFTPTSVLRKMTAEKDSDLVSKQLSAAQHQIEAQLLLQKQGRPIVKGNTNFSVPPPVDMMQLKAQQQQQMAMQQRSKQPPQQPPPQHMFMNMNHSNPPPNSQPGPGNRPGMGVRTMGGQNMIPQQQQQQSMNRSVQQLLMNHNYNSSQQRNNAHLKPELQGLMRSQNQMVMGRNYQQHGPGMNYQPGSDGSPASPVSNQLARWFSPELLAQARAGKLPDMPPLSPTQNMLSVEELERLQQAVHN